MELLKPLDYSKEENWLVNEKDKVGCDYDLIYIVGTSINFPSLESGVGTNLDEFVTMALANYNSVGKPLNDNARAFVPKQRQIALMHALKKYQSHNDIIRDIGLYEPYYDLEAALDYYFANYNKDAKRPFVLAGHSQGAASCQVLLEKYFLNSERKKYLKSLVCIYALGYGISKKWFDGLNKDNLIHFATGKDDYHSVVSWNLEGDGEKGKSFLLADDEYDTLLINPLNWKVDETYTPKELNKGVVMDDGKPIGQFTLFYTEENKYLFDAKIDLKRGSLITTCCTNYIAFPGAGEVWGGKSLHSYDARAFHSNLKENVRLRVNNFINKK